MLRILAVADMWQGSNAYAYVRAFRRAGHSVRVVPPESYMPSFWTNKFLKGVRRLLEPVIVKDYAQALIKEAEALQPHLFFVFKGRCVTAQAVSAVRERGAVAINFYPDVSFLCHGPYIPQALPQYDWVFTTKSFGLRDMEQQLGIRNASFIPHSFDPETHRPITLSQEEEALYNCDVSFIGTWSPKKQRYLEHLKQQRPDLRLRIWGEQYWKGDSTILSADTMKRGVYGLEYAKALVGSRVNLAILSEARKGSSSGDLITSRTFHIPATGAFMLHERTPELLQLFDEGRHCGCFATPEEMVSQVGHFLTHEKERKELAQGGYERSHAAGYGVDNRAQIILAKFAELFKARHGVAPNINARPLAQARAVS